MTVSKGAGQQGEIGDPGEDLVRLARIALASEIAGVQSLVRQLVRKYRDERPDVSKQLVQLLRPGTTRGVAAPARVDTLPVDTDSRMPLLRDDQPGFAAERPILPADLEMGLSQIVQEHLSRGKLARSGLYPTRTVLFAGPPGVGKTMTARWVASELGLPLLTLDLSAVMSSYLGRTGGNLRRVLDYAKGRNAVLLLDELDAIAKKRDDATEVGELKRLVTVLLQEVDAWPEGSLLLAATNHGTLLDPAVWRRFEVVLDFPLPALEQIAIAVDRHLDGEVSDPVQQVLTASLQGLSLSDVESRLLSARRTAVVSGEPLERVVLTHVRTLFHALPAGQRGRLASKIVSATSLSQREVHGITGVSRDTIRKYAAQ